MIVRRQSPREREKERRLASVWRCEGVGSLLRPAVLLEARKRYEAGELDPPELKAIEDRAVDAAVQLQEDVGLEVVSDGELRRESWISHLFESFEGFDRTGGLAMPWRDGAGQAQQTDTRRAVVAGRLGWRRSMCGEEWVYLRSRTHHQAKVTLASAEMAAAVYDAEHSAVAYPVIEDYFAHVVELLRMEVGELVRLGCTYIQFDAPQYGALVDARLRDVFKDRGSDPERMIDAGIEMDNAVIDGFPGVVFGLHVCRGNNKSLHYGEGGYEPIRRLFRRSHFDRFLLEYDDDRSGGFEPLASVPDDRVVVLGLVTTKHPELEPAEELRKRIEKASQFVPLERLALSPQCGFASVEAGNAITPEQQRAKLDLVARVARQVWGEGRG